MAKYKITFGPSDKGYRLVYVDGLLAGDIDRTVDVPNRKRVGYSVTLYTPGDAGGLVHEHARWFHTLKEVKDAFRGPGSGDSLATGIWDTPTDLGHARFRRRRGGRVRPGSAVDPSGQRRRVV